MYKYYWNDKLSPFSALWSVEVIDITVQTKRTSTCTSIIEMTDWVHLVALWSVEVIDIPWPQFKPNILNSEY